MKNDFSFENAMKRLSEITEILEKNELTLDESIALYEEGVELSAKCKAKLEQAQMKITVLDEQSNEKEM